MLDVWSSDHGLSRDEVFDLFDARRTMLALRLVLGGPRSLSYDEFYEMLDASLMTFKLPKQQQVLASAHQGGVAAAHQPQGRRSIPIARPPSPPALSNFST